MSVRMKPPPVEPDGRHGCTPRIDAAQRQTQPQIGASGSPQGVIHCRAVADPSGIQGPSPIRASVPKPTVVVADDHALILERVQALLAPRFDVVGTAENGRRAVEAAERHHPDCMVLDVVMPGTDGFTAAREMREDGFTGPVVFISGRTDDDFVLTGLEVGGTGFVSKSRMQLDLVDALEHALAGRAFAPSATVLPRWRRIDAAPHDLQLYANDDALLGAVAAYFAAALAA